MNEMEKLPTEEVNPNSIYDLFQADPEDLGEQDIDRIVDHFRKKRSLFLIEEQKRATKGKVRKGTKEVPQDLSLDELLA